MVEPVNRGDGPLERSRDRGSDPARESGADLERALDELVPPPWSPARRALVAGGVVLAVAVLTAAWWGGLLGPRLPPGDSGFGSSSTVQGETGEITAEQRVPLRNRGRVSATIHRIDLPDLDGVTWQQARVDGVGELPVDLAPGEAVLLRLAFAVEDCAAVDADGLTSVPLRASSGLAPARTVNVEVRSVARHPQWPPGDRDPSWVYATVAGPCSDLDE